jgi:two-component system sensor histidine kinase RegB
MTWNSRGVEVSMVIGEDDAGRSPEPGDDVRSWSLVRLRWGSVAGQVLIVLVAWRVARLPLPVATLLGLSAVTAISNALLWLWLRSRGRLPITWIGSILAFDTLLLTALLYVTGGVSNPFSVFYLVQITAAASLLGSRWTWSLTALGVSCYAALFILPAAPADAESEHMAHMFSGHLRGMWAALTLAAALTAYFVTRLTAGLARRDREILAMRERAARRDRISAVSTLAAGAAHELATPLNTVAVVAGELETALASLANHRVGELTDDVRVIRQEVLRCREILESIGVGSGGMRGEMPARFTAEELAQETLARLQPGEAARLQTTIRGGDVPLFLPRRALERVVLSLVRNALEASPVGRSVAVEVQAGSVLQVSVRDSGTGMPPEVLARAGEPFFTTKPPGQGLGLGLFLAKSLSEQLRGRFLIESAPEQGTRARLEIPLRVTADEH